MGGTALDRTRNAPGQYGLSQAGEARTQEDLA